MKKILYLLFVMIVLFPAGADFYSLRVLGLYKSSEGQTARENEIFYYLSRPLSEMGLKIDYWDVDSGIPPQSSLKGVRGIISWFRGASMSDPEGYLKFLNSAIDSGRKLVVLDNFGAYQSRKTGKYLDTGLINLTLSRLGLMYLGDWTDDPRLIRISRKDSAMVEKGGAQNVEDAAFFYRFFTVDRDLKTFLSLRRTDRDYAESPVITTNKNGGFALSKYIYRLEVGKVNMLLDLEAFIEKALFPEPSGERIALLADPNHFKSGEILKYTEQILRRARLPYDVITRVQFPNLIVGDLNRFTTVALILAGDSGLNPVILEDFLDRGGSLVSFLGGNFNQLAQVLALSDKSPPVKSSKGYRFRFGFLLGEGLSLEDSSLDWRPGSKLPSDDAEVLAQSYRGDVPIVWTAQRGKGKVLVWNWDAHAIGEFMGPMLESFLYVRPVGIAATAGLGIMMIDDWSLPMYNIVKPPLTITDTEFYTRVFWPDMKKIFSEEKIPFTTYLIFNYNARIEPPFSGGEFFVSEGMASLNAANEMIAGDQELGYHGYNHLSLTLDRTEVNLYPWPSIEAMKESVEEARREWISLFGEQNLPFSYVPVNNIISQDGEEALLSAMPSIKVISSLRAGMGEITTTEYGPVPNFPDVYYIPRTSWGYPFTPYIKQLITSGIAGEGIWSHFVHPDDVFDEHRSGGKSWEELRNDFQSMIEFVKRHYPWLRYVKVKDAYYILKEMDETGVEYRWEGDDLVIDSRPGMLFRIRLNDRKVERLEGARCVYEYRRMPVLILETTGNETRIALKK